MLIYSAIFIVSGAVLETIFHFLEKFTIYLYARGGKVRSSKIYKIPFELLYWGKFIVVSLSLYFMMVYTKGGFSIIEIIFFFSIFVLGMYVLNQYFKDLKY